MIRCIVAISGLALAPGMVSAKHEKEAAGDRRAELELSRTLAALRIPQDIARGYRPGAKRMPKGLCGGMLIYRRRGEYFVANANTAEVGRRGDGLTDLAVLTPRPHTIHERVHQKGWHLSRRVAGSYETTFRRGDVEVTSYRFRDQTGDVRGTLHNCVGKSDPLIEHGHVFIIRTVPRHLRRSR